MAESDLDRRWKAESLPRVSKTRTPRGKVIREAHQLKDDTPASHICQIEHTIFVQRSECLLSLRNHHSSSHIGVIKDRYNEYLDT